MSFPRHRVYCRRTSRGALHVRIGSIARLHTSGPCAGYSLIPRHSPSRNADLLDDHCVKFGQRVAQLRLVPQFAQSGDEPIESR